MKIERNHIWVEITEQEYNKHALIIPDNPTFEQALKAVFCYNPKLIVKREVIIPDHICGIMNVSDYLESKKPKQYKYFKSIGRELNFIVSEEEHKHLKQIV